MSSDQLKLTYGDIELRIESDQEFVLWRTANRCSASDVVIIQGHCGCLDLFTSTFDGENADLEIVVEGGSKRRRRAGVGAVEIGGAHAGNSAMGDDGSGSSHLAHLRREAQECEAIWSFGKRSGSWC